MCPEEEDEEYSGGEEEAGAFDPDPSGTLGEAVDAQQGLQTNGSTQPGGGSSIGQSVSQSEDVISSVGKLAQNKDTFARPGGYGQGG